MDKKRIKNIIYTLGKLAGIVALIYVLYKLSQEYTLSSFLERLSSIKQIIIPLIVINFISLLIGIYGWYIMLLQYSKIKFKYITAYYYYAKTDISKYLPGNIFHLVGRQAFASKIGISQVDMAKVSLFHTISILVATILSSTILILFVSSIESYIKYLMILASIISLIVIYYLFPTFSKKKKSITTTLFTISVLMQGLLLSIIVYWQIDSISFEEFLKVTSIYILSWLIGFVTPGASGGLGVREGAFLAISNFIHLNISTDIILFSVLLVRLINILVDILMFISTFFIKKEYIEL